MFRRGPNSMSINGHAFSLFFLTLEVTINIINVVLYDTYEVFAPRNVPLDDNNVVQGIKMK